jgi:hypothetical protein
MSAIQRNVFPFGPTITDAYNISTNGTAVFGDNSNNLLTVFTPASYISQFAVKGNINCIGTNTDVSGASTGTYYSSSVSATSIPADSSANRPPQKLTGYIRYNSDLSQNNIEYYNGFVPAWQQIMTTTYYQSVVSISPTQKSFRTSGSTTYTPTSTSVLYIKIRMVGGGGGGAGSGGSGIGAGGNGTATTFISGVTTLFTANPGLGGQVNGNVTTASSPGGTITDGSGVIFAGGQGGGATNYYSTGTQGGGPGGSSYFGGNGGGAGGSVNLSGGPGRAGGGGGGAGTYTTGSGTGLQTGAGGSAGGYIEVYLSSPASSYSITVGAGGAAGTQGTGGGGGGTGGTGLIIIDEYYH